MVGWYDAVEKGDTLRYGGFQDLMINKLDALTGAATGRATCCSARPTSMRPASATATSRATRRCARRCGPVYASYPGWTEDVSKIRRFGDLPAAARRYVAAMVKAILEVAYAGETWPAELPNPPLPRRRPPPLPDHP